MNQASETNAVDARINALGDWRGEMLASIRTLIKEADLEVTEGVKWRKSSNSMLGVPVWEHNGLLCTGEIYKDKVKFTFAQGASLPDPEKAFNSSLDGGTRHAIDIFEGDQVNEEVFKELIRAAVALNTSKKKGKR